MTGVYWGQLSKCEETKLSIAQYSCDNKTAYGTQMNPLSCFCFCFSISVHLILPFFSLLPFNYIPLLGAVSAFATLLFLIQLIFTCSLIGWNEEIIDNDLLDSGRMFQSSMGSIGDVEGVSGRVGVESKERTGRTLPGPSGGRNLYQPVLSIETADDGSDTNTNTTDGMSSRSGSGIGIDGIFESPKRNSDGNS